MSAHLSLSWLSGPGLAALMAGLSAALWALFDLLSTFSDEVGDIMMKLWAWIYLGGHAMGAMALYALVHPWLVSLAPWAQGLVVGLGFQSLLRVRLQVLRPMGLQGEPLELAPLEEFLSRFQGFCRRRLDRALVRDRLGIIRDLMGYPEEQLLDFAFEVIAATQLEDPNESLERLRQRLRALPEEKERRLYLANFLLRRAGRRTVRRRLREAAHTAPGDQA